MAQRNDKIIGSQKALSYQDLNLQTLSSVSTSRFSGAASVLPFGELAARDDQLPMNTMFTSNEVARCSLKKDGEQPKSSLNASSGSLRQLCSPLKTGRKGTEAL